MDKLKIQQEQREPLLDAFEKHLEAINKEMDEKESDDLGEFRVVMTKEVPDRMNEIVDIEGMKTSNFMKNPVVLKNHQSDAMPVGKVQRIITEGDELVAEGNFAPSEDGQMLRQLWEKGFLNTSSIGFIPEEVKDIDDVTHITRSELLELSLVSVPANQDALRRTFDEEQVKTMVTKGIVAEEKLDQEKLDETFANYQEATNMTEQELKNWAETECSQLASQDRSPIERNIRLLSKNKEDWTEQDIVDAKKTVSFIARMKENLGGQETVEDSEGRNCGTKAHIALKNWAFDSKKAKQFEEAEQKTSATLEEKIDQLYSKMEALEQKFEPEAKDEQEEESETETQEKTEDGKALEDSQQSPEGETEADTDEGNALVEAKEIHQEFVKAMDSWLEKHKKTARKYYKRKK